ncbi:hypothetical protein [Xanthovirga aplysinae]|uniref:hypothetical protein n=1 Tax=Xanthovirga aplysinae TaxID=2529853 RepID=UPI0012BB558F|nr:hypothetical protein [Xanthovirga aplysinae]MTI33073.1 hypothetical protein [Xanthovirga aplysinae]
MKRKKLHLILVMVLMGVSLSKAQTAQETATPTVSPSEMTLLQQFEDLKSKSNSYQEYKVVKMSWLNSFWSNVQDSIQATEIELVKAKENINAQQLEINQLDQDLKKREQEVAESQYAIEHINVLGIDFGKGSYVLFNWIIIIILIVLLVGAIFKFKESNIISKKKVEEYNSLENEFKDYKQRAFEKETRLRRDMQTEMNRAEELKQKLAMAQK